MVHRSRHLLLLLRCFLELATEQCRNAMRNSGGELFQSLLLGFRDWTGLMSVTLQLLPANFVKPVAQGDEGGDKPSRRELASKGLRFLFDNFLGNRGGRAALAHIVRHHVLEVVDVV